QRDENGACDRKPERFRKGLQINGLENVLVVVQRELLHDAPRFSARLEAQNERVHEGARDEHQREYIQGDKHQPEAAALLHSLASSTGTAHSARHVIRTGCPGSRSMSMPWRLATSSEPSPSVSAMRSMPPAKLFSRTTAGMPPSSQNSMCSL